MNINLVIEVIEFDKAAWVRSCDLMGFDWAWRVICGHKTLIQGYVVGNKALALKNAKRSANRLARGFSGQSLRGFDNNIKVVEQ